MRSFLALTSLKIEKESLAWFQSVPVGLIVGLLLTVETNPREERPRGGGDGGQ
jgi:hypothetical protein